jgi:hypothetical protein
MEYEISLTESAKRDMAFFKAAEQRIIVAGIVAHSRTGEAQRPLHSREKGSAMKTVNLRKVSPSVVQLLAMARKDSVLLLSEDGATFVLEEADEFEREAAALGGSERFIRFLRKRSRDEAKTSIEEFARQLAQETRNKTSQRTSRSQRKPKPRKKPRAARA